MVITPDPPADLPRPVGRHLAVGLAAAGLLAGLTAGLTALALRDAAPGPGPAGAPGGPAVPPFPRGRSGADYRPDRAVLGAALPGLLAGRTPTGAPVPALLARLTEPVALAGCLTALLPPGDPAARPVALDYARLGGKPALLVVLPADDPGQVEVFVVGPACAAADEDLLFYARLPRPGR